MRSTPNVIPTNAEIKPFCAKKFEEPVLVVAAGALPRCDVRTPRRHSNPYP